MRAVSQTAQAKAEHTSAANGCGHKRVLEFKSADPEKMAMLLKRRAKDPADHMPHKVVSHFTTDSVSQRKWQWLPGAPAASGKDKPYCGKNPRNPERCVCSPSGICHNPRVFCQVLPFTEAFGACVCIATRRTRRRASPRAAADGRMVLAMGSATRTSRRSATAPSHASVCRACPNESNPHNFDWSCRRMHPIICAVLRYQMCYAVCCRCGSDEPEWIKWRQPCICPVSELPDFQEQFDIKQKEKEAALEVSALTSPWHSCTGQRVGPALLACPAHRACILCLYTGKGQVEEAQEAGQGAASQETAKIIVVLSSDEDVARPSATSFEDAVRSVLTECRRQRSMVEESVAWSEAVVDAEALYASISARPSRREPSTAAYWAAQSMLAKAAKGILTLNAPSQPRKRRGSASEVLSAYEQKRAKTMAANAQFLESLAIERL